jgi:RecA-family ATPase
MSKLRVADDADARTPGERSAAFRAHADVAEAADAAACAMSLEEYRAAIARGSDPRREAEELVRGHLPDALWQFLADRDGDWFNTEPPARRYLLSDAKGGVLPLGRVGMLAAGGGMGKSWALTQLALAVATGRPWLGFKVDQPGNVLLALAEEEQAELQRRLYYASQELGLTADERRLATERILPLPLAGRSVALTYAAEQAGKDQDVSTAFAAALELRLRLFTWSLLILDPVSRFAGPDVEIDNAAATRFVQQLERLTAAPGNPTVLVAHHTAKGTRNGQSTASAARGSSALTDGIRWQANLDPITEKSGGKDEPPRIVAGFACLRVTKSNYGRYPEPVYVQRVDDRHGVLRQVDEGAWETAPAAAATGQRVRI